jgi:adenylylsulfate reductase subunit A
LLFREETRWPGYYFRADKPSMDHENWDVFANCKYDPVAKKWEMIKRPILRVFKEDKQPELVG